MSKGGNGADDPANHDAGDDNGVDVMDNHGANQGANGGGGPGPGNGGGPDNSGPPVVANETLTGTPLNDRLEGGNGDDSITGLAGDDRLEGKDGNDTIDGGAGDDLIRGGKGADVLTGGQGNDTFVIDSLSGAKTQAALDQITDFTHGQDKLVFDDAPAVTATNFATDTEADFTHALASANAKIAAGADFVAVQVGADVMVFADAVGEHHVESAVILVGKSLADITSSDIG